MRLFGKSHVESVKKDDVYSDCMVRKCMADMLDAQKKEIRYRAHWVVYLETLTKILSLPNVSDKAKLVYIKHLSHEGIDEPHRVLCLPHLPNDTVEMQCFAELESEGVVAVKNNTVDLLIDMRYDDGE